LLTIINFSAKSIIIAQNNRSPFPANRKKKSEPPGKTTKNHIFFRHFPSPAAKNHTAGREKSIFLTKFQFFYQLLVFFKSGTKNHIPETFSKTVFKTRNRGGQGFSLPPW